MLADGRSFLQGSAAGLADLAAYHPVWYLRQKPRRIMTSQPAAMVTVAIAQLAPTTN
jgi:hypothetical protein